RARLPCLRLREIGVRALLVLLRRDADLHEARNALVLLLGQRNRRVRFGERGLGLLDFLGSRTFLQPVQVRLRGSELRLRALLLLLAAAGAELIELRLRLLPRPSRPLLLRVELLGLEGSLILPLGNMLLGCPDVRVGLLDGGVQVGPHY